MTPARVEAAVSIKNATGNFPEIYKKIDRKIIDTRTHHSIVPLMANMENLAELMGRYPFDTAALNRIAAELHRHATPGERQFRKQAINHGQYVLPESQHAAQKLEEAERIFQANLGWAMSMEEGENYCRALSKEPTLPWELQRILQEVEDETSESLCSKNIITDDIQRLRDLLKAILATYVIRTEMMPVLASSARGDLHHFVHAIKSLMAEVQRKFRIPFDRVPPTFALMR